MICRLCLKDIVEVIRIFDEIGTELNVAFLLGKYFWFEPKIDDPISTAICNSCWIKVSNFHQFYESVEEAHRLLTERFSIKSVQIASGNDVTEKDEQQEDSVEDKHFIQPNWESDIIANDGGLQLNVFAVSDAAEYTKDENDIKLCSASSKNKENASELEFASNEEHFIEVTFESEMESDSDDDDVKPVTEELIGDVEQRRASLRSRTSARVQYDEQEHSCGGSSDTKSENFYKNDRILNRKSEKLRRSPERPKSASDTQHKKNSKQRCRSIECDEKIAKHMRLICELCNIEVPTFAAIQQHFQNVHSQKGYVICCNKKLYKRILLMDHINKHLDPEYFKCNDCNKVFADKQCLRNHVLIMHQADKDKTFECEHCPKKFVKRYLLEQHRPIHVPAEERKHICDVCLKPFPNATSLTAHQKNVHNAAYGTMCHICAKVIRGKAAFKKHQLEHSGVKVPEVQCEKCGSWLKDKYSLQKHMRRHNDEGTLHICCICRKVAPNQSALRSHFRYVHASQRTYECSVCKKAFKKPLNLKEHMTTHTGEVLYSCPHCPKTFNSNANMHSHRKKMHPKEWEENRKYRKGKITGKSNESSDSINDSINTSLRKTYSFGTLNESSEKASVMDVIITEYTSGGDAMYNINAHKT